MEAVLIPQSLIWCWHIKSFGTLTICTYFERICSWDPVNNINYRACIFFYSALSSKEFLTISGRHWITVVSLFNHEDSTMCVWLFYMRWDMTDRMWKGQYSYDYSLVTLEDFPSTCLFHPFALLEKESQRVIEIDSFPFPSLIQVWKKITYL